MKYCDLLKKALTLLKNSYINVKYYKKHMIIFKPTMKYVSTSAHISVSKKFLFNKQWDIIRQNRNKIVASLHIGNNATLKVDSFTFYAGTRLTINPNAVLILGTGYANYNTTIECFTRSEI